MSDYDAARAKVRKLVEKPSDDSTKLPRAQSEHDEARDIFNILNDQLITELPILVDLRIRASCFAAVREFMLTSLQPILTRPSRL